MNVFEFVLLIIIIVTVGRLVERNIGRSRDRGPTLQEEVGRGSSGKLEELEKRVQVLERIVTDQGYELRQKFRDLDG